MKRLKDLENRDKELDSLIRRAEKEIYQFKYNKSLIMVEDLIDIAIDENVENLTKLNKEFPGSYVTLFSEIQPILTVKKG